MHDYNVTEIRQGNSARSLPRAAEEPVGSLHGLGSRPPRRRTRGVRGQPARDRGRSPRTRLRRPVGAGGGPAGRRRDGARRPEDRRRDRRGPGLDDGAPRPTRRQGHHPRARRGGAGGRPRNAVGAGARAGRRADGRGRPARAPGLLSVRLGRRRQTERGRHVVAGRRVRRAQPDPQRAHRRGESGAPVAVGSRPVHGTRRGRLALRSRCRRHEMRADGDPRGRERPA